MCIRDSPKDYTYRDMSLAAMPWYFFVAACEARTQADESTLPWREYGTQRHPHYELGKPVKSETMSCNLQENGKLIREYPYYVSLRTEEAWRVPLILGKIPSPPKADDSSKTKGNYALFMMLLFKPWQGTRCPDFFEHILG